METIVEEDKRSLLQRFILWRERKIKEKHFVLILSFLVGICTALAAWFLKSLVEWIKEFLTENFDSTGVNWLYLVYPVIGIFLTGLFIRYVVKDDISHGVTKILYAISRRQSRIKRHNTWSSVIASGITIGFGGSVGAEAPIVLTGSAIGSNLGSMFKMEYNTLMLLVGCGAAGAVAGIFKAPIAGLVFTLEVLMIDLTMASLLPLLVSSVTAATLAYILTGFGAMFRFHMDHPFLMERIPAVILLGILCGLVSLYFTRAMNGVENIFRRYSNPYIKLLIGGAMLSVLIFLFPPLFGEGYDTIELLLNGVSTEEWNSVMNNSIFYGYSHLLLLYLTLIVLFKVFASSATNGGGGCGGIFAPSLFLGCITGFVMAHFCNQFDLEPLIPHIPEKNFALLGMAGLMSGVMHAPLTGIFLIAELTGGYDLFLPLMIVSVCAYLTIMIFEPHSLYSMRLAKKGELITHHKDKAVLTLLSIDSVVEDDFEQVRPEMDLGEMVRVISRAKRNLFPVVDASGRLLGIVALDDIRNIMFRQELYHRFKVEKFMVSPPARIHVSDSMEEVMKAFDDTKAWNLPVVDEEGKYKGFVSKSKIFNSYRQVLVDFSAD
ncbi:MAG: chloride channel protein [Bacteroidales bacterium]|nr:chloride channel protein [Bacteroidales bacterium]